MSENTNGGLGFECVVKCEELEMQAAERIFLFGSHLGFGFGGFVGLASEVE